MANESKILTEGTGFKVKFDMMDYKHLAPVHLLNDTDNIINYQHRKNGDVDKCIWTKESPKRWQDVYEKEFQEREALRILKDGAWIAIKESVLWLPPNYYFALKYGKAGNDNIQFRLKRLKHVYHKLTARNNPGCIGTYTIKNRQDGETTMAITDAFWECLDGNLSNGQIGIQSKTRNDAYNPCWRTMQILWLGLPTWLKDLLCSDFSSDKIEEKIRFQRSADEMGEGGRNILMSYFPSVHNAMDGLNNMVKCILDEINKWKECSFIDTFINYKKFIMPGFERKGLYDIFSSPADINGRWNDEAFAFWKDSNPDEIDPETGSTKNRIFRYYSNPLEGIQGAYDMFGDADPDKIYAHIMRERKNTKPEKLMSEIRGYPLNEDEMFGSFDAINIWDNLKGIKERKIYLVNRRFKDDSTKEPVAVWGNLEWRDGIADTEVDFRMADKTDFDNLSARFCFSHLPQNKQPLKSVFRPDPYVENCLGIDPYNLRYETKQQTEGSKGAAVNHKFRDIFNTGINKCPTMLYLARPFHQDLFFEDMIKAAVFNRALVQYENRSDKLANYFEDRGYFDWLLPEIGAKRDSNRKGDAPSGKGKFLEEGIALVNAITNLPLKPDDPYLLERNWLLHLIDDILHFNQRDTQKNDPTMAWMQALIGAAKIMMKKVREPSEVNDAVFDYLLT